jgi:hypothetical protein
VNGAQTWGTVPSLSVVAYNELKQRAKTSLSPNSVRANTELTIDPIRGNLFNNLQVIA